MRLQNELEKMKSFLETPAPYLCAILGIIVAVYVLNANTWKSGDPYTRSAMAFCHTVPSAVEEEEFEFCYYCTGPDTFDVLSYVSDGIAIAASIPAITASYVFVSSYDWISPPIPDSRLLKTFNFLFVYFNAYFFMFAAFGIYSAHLDAPSRSPGRSLTVLDLKNK